MGGVLRNWVPWAFKNGREKKKKGGEGRGEGDVVTVLALILADGGMAIVGGLPVRQSELVICL